MKITTSLVALILGASLLPAAPPPPGFTPLFNGKDLAGWRGGETFDHRKLLDLSAADRAGQLAKWTATMTEVNPKTGKPHWHVEGDELVNDGRGAYASTIRDYGDCELLLEYKTVAGADSGIYLRGVPQIQIWDITQPSQAKDPKIRRHLGSGGLWNNPAGAPGRDPLVAADKPLGQWNTVRVIMVGSRVSVWLNDKQVVDHAILENVFDAKLPAGQRRPIPSHGPIQLQTHGGEIRWRNLFIREIGAGEANRVLASRGGESFTKIFDGHSLEGWAGAVDNVEVKDGAMVWRENRRGVAYWNHELADFQTRLMFKLPKAGNNGLAIRCPGAGDDAHKAMCEVQILDDNYEVHKPEKLDPRHVHGSAYGMVAAIRGYQRPLGEWNFQEVTVQGSTIKVELNGIVILDTDLSKVDLATAKGNHSGRDRKSGFFGFAGHDDPVAFKEVSIKKL
ncbi:MAG: 3-keto-disaccharide hydrolase [Opitutaceae bacterium]